MCVCMLKGCFERTPKNLFRMNVYRWREEGDDVWCCMQSVHMHILSLPLCVCVCVCEFMWLLRLSSVQALKVGPDFTVISHPNGSCHTSCQHAAGEQPRARRRKENSTDIQSVSYSLSEQKSLNGLETKRQ